MVTLDTVCWGSKEITQLKTKWKFSDVHGNKKNPTNKIQKEHQNSGSTS